MTARSSRPDPPPPPLSKWIMWGGALIVLAIAVVVAAVSWFVLRHLYGGQGAQVQLDVIRTAGTLVIATGGAVALLLTARRQRYTELALVHTDRDATERRITELYTKAANQLGSDQAPVRLAGLYALERLAHSTVEHRQTIVDVICAYLRMPYTPPSTLGRSYRSPGPARRRRARILTDRPLHATPTSRHEQAQQERQVRLTAQNILFRNLHLVAQPRRRWWHRTPPPAVPTWSGTRLALTEALLLEFSLAQCQLNYADLTRAKFIAEAHFTNARFTDLAHFVDVQFTDSAHFEDVQFTDSAFFTGAQFTDSAFFTGAQFTGEARFEDVQFTGSAFFHGARFAHVAVFLRARFAGGVGFTDAQFPCGALFGGAQFTAAVFTGAQFTGEAYFRAAQLAEAVFRNAQFTGEARFNDAQFTGEVDFGGAQFTGEVDFGGAQFTGEVDFGGARIASAAEQDAVWPPGWTTRPAKPDNGEDPAFLYLARVQGGNPPDT